MRKYLVAALILTLAYTAYGIELKRVMAMKPKATVTAISPKTHVFGLQSTVQGWEAILVSEESVLKLGGVDTSSPEGERYSFPFNGSTPFAGTPAQGMFQTTTAGPQWFDGEAWVPVGVAYNDTALWAKFAEYLRQADHGAYVAAAQVRFDNLSTQMGQLKAAVIAVGGTLVGAAPPTLTALAFGNVTTSETRTLTAQLGNSGLGNLVIGTATKAGTGAAKYTLNGGCSGQTLIKGASCLESITFAPGAGTGEFTAQISFPHNGAGSPTLLDLTGTGVAPVVATCSTTPSLDIATAGNTASQAGSSTSNNYNGILVETGQASRTVCKVAFYIHTITGGVGGLNYQAEVWGTDGNKALTGIVKAISTPVSGGNISEGGYVVFTFNTPVPVLATDAIVLTRTDHGSNSTNYVSVGVSTVADTSSPSGVYSHAARWNSTGAIASESTTQDKRVLIYEVQ